ncbi:unnamed protein product [Didymodactylos carnosus]|uniref:Mitochondrial carrier protein n=1 Tax=Didymodactylos carnosus TaxID=1234261 RepID=A0A813TPE9_9BILA|nr:unnamed protein product [Didymodactylos carnosus]CAF1173437.1 unnamed protein product [Didymodactylos carnosus]CAF3602801.1 unnamed protein product [Didymodactylos carnosus]CAF3984694.1 unnamed protein product [Didymodactylos carnosus]
MVIECRYFSATKDVLAGSGGGLVSILVSHPLNTVIIQLRTNPDTYKSALHCARSIWNKQGILGYYKNKDIPMVSPAIIMSEQFFFYGQLKRWLGIKEIDDNYEISRCFLAGALTGCISSFIETPLELIHCQIQRQIKQHTHVFDPNVLDGMKYILNTNGLFGFYRGFTATIIRSVPACMFFFGGYEWTKRKLYTNTSSDWYSGTKEYHFRLTTLLGGACGGLACWFSCYPFDVIKSAIQTDDIRREHRKYTSYMDCVKQLYQDGGIKIFFRGFVPIVLRTIPVSAACFLAYEEIYRVLE